MVKAKKVLLFVFSSFLLILPSCTPEQYNEYFSTDSDSYSYNNDGSIKELDQTFNVTPQGNGNTLYEAKVSSSMFGSLAFKGSFTWGKDIALNSDFKTFNKDLARFAFYSVIDAHDDGLVSIGNINKDQTENKMFLQETGFKNIEKHRATSKTGEDTNDTTNFLISFAEYDNRFSFVNISFLGTNGDSEWESNYDIGNESEEYKTLGNHSEWTNKSNHKGLDIAANRAIDIINDYCKANLTYTEKVYLLVSGYSRGAAVGNVVAAKMEDGDIDIGTENYVSTAYTFATPVTTTSKNVKSYKTIYNFIDEEDIITSLPSPAAGLIRYGTDLVSHVRGTDNQRKWETIMGRTLTESFAPYIISAMDAVIGTRENLYAIKDSIESRVNFTCRSYEAAEEKMNSLIADFTKLNANTFVRFSSIRRTGYNEYSFYYNYSIGFLIKTMPSILNNIVNRASKGIISFSFDTISDDLWPLLIGAALGGINGSIPNFHLPLAYYFVLEDYCNK